MVDLVFVVQTVGILIILGFGVVLYFREHYEPLKATAMCPHCHRWWNSEIIEAKQLGIFRKGVPTSGFSFQLRGSAVKMIPVAKFEVLKRCRKCGYEWKSIELKRL